MHLWRSTNKADGFRGHLHFNLPLNPICWLLGHHAKASIEGTDGHRWLHVRCRWCDRRYTEPDYVARLAKQQPAPGELKRLAEQRLANAERDLRQWAKDRSGRAGYGEREVDLGWQLVWRGLERKHGRRRGWTHTGIGFSIGGRGSETPIDLHIGCGLAALFITIGGIGGRTCGWLSQRTGGYESREVEVRIHNWRLWWSIWTKKHSWSRSDGWRHGTLRLHPLDHLLGGEAKYAYTDVEEPRSAFIHPPSGGSYLVEFQLQSWVRRRPRGRDLASGWEAEWKCKEGIPTRRDDGWKGGSIYGSSVKLPADRTEWPLAPGLLGGVYDWLPLAVKGLTESVERDREKANYRPEVDA
jgi:hypothetical protein